MLVQIPTSGGQSASFATTSQEQPHQSQALKSDNSCDIPRALCANTRSTSHKPAVKCATTYAVRIVLQHSTPGVALGRVAWGCLVAPEYHRWAALMCIHTQTAERTSNEKRAPLKHLREYGSLPPSSCLLLPLTWLYTSLRTVLRNIYPLSKPREYGLLPPAAARTVLLLSIGFRRCLHKVVVQRFKCID